MKQPKVLITPEEFSAFVEKWPETIASLTEMWIPIQDAITNTVRVLMTWLEENEIGICECHAENLTYKGMCLRCDKED